MPYANIISHHLPSCYDGSNRAIYLIKLHLMQIHCDWTIVVYSCCSCCCCCCCTACTIFLCLQFLCAFYNTYGKPRESLTLAFFLLASSSQWCLQGSIQRGRTFLVWIFYCNSFLCHGIKREKRDSEPKTLPTFDCNHYNESY